MTTAATLEATRTPAPQVPVTLEDTGLGADQVEQLLVKSLYGGEATGLMLSDRVRLPFAILEPIIERMRFQQLIESRDAQFGARAGVAFAEGIVVREPVMRDGLFKGK